MVMDGNQIYYGDTNIKSTYAVHLKLYNILYVNYIAFFFKWLLAFPGRRNQNPGGKKDEESIEIM